MKKIFLLITVFIVSFIFISKPKAYSYNDVTFYIDGNKITDSFQYINFDINTTGLDSTVNLMGIDTAGTYYVRLEFCSRSWDNYIFDSKDFNYTITNEVCELNSTTTGLKRILDIKLVTWNGITPGNTHTYGISSKLVPHNAKSDRFAFKMLNFAVFNSSEYNQLKEQDKTNEKLDNIDNTMKDDDIDTSGANSFFDDFDNKDHGGLSSIITSPLKAYSKITAKCTPISLNVLDKEVMLPCGDTLFWDKSNVSAFRIIWNILLGGPILYALLVKLYKTIEGLKNPDDDRIEVTKL